VNVRRSEAAGAARTRELSVGDVLPYWPAPADGWYGRIVQCGSMRIWDGDSLEPAAAYASTVLRFDNERTAAGIGAWVRRMPSRLGRGSYWVPIYDAAAGAEAYTDEPEVTYYLEWDGNSITRLELL